MIMVFWPCSCGRLIQHLDFSSKHSLSKSVKCDCGQSHDVNLDIIPDVTTFTKTIKGEGCHITGLNEMLVDHTETYEREGDDEDDD